VLPCVLIVLLARLIKISVFPYSQIQFRDREVLESKRNGLMFKKCVRSKMGSHIACYTEAGLIGSKD
jgi:hypothetical protein